MRKPATRLKGRYTNVPVKELSMYAEQVVDKLSEKYPELDLIDLEYAFTKQLADRFAMAILRESAVNFK